MKNNYFIILLISALFFNANLFADDEVKGVVTGKLTDGQSLEPIAYASISIFEKSSKNLLTGCLSDESGEFKIDNIGTGLYYIEIHFMGYKSVNIDSLVIDKNNRFFNLGEVKMAVDATLLDEIQVSEKVAPIKNAVDRQIINVSQNLNAQGGTAAEALRLSPSVQVESNGDIKLRGSKKFLVLINGKPSTLDPNTALSQIPASTIQNIEIITNPSVKYNAEGGAGIINIVLKKGIMGNLNGMVNASIGTRNKYSSDVSINLNKEKVSYSIGLEWRDYTEIKKNNYFMTRTDTDTIYKNSNLQHREHNDKNTALRFGVDYNPSETLNLYYSLHTGVTGRFLDLGIPVNTYTIPSNKNINKFNTFLFENTIKYATNNIGFSKTLNSKMDKITANLYYSFIDYDLVTDQTQAFSDVDYNVTDPTPFMQYVNNKNHSNDVRIDVDYIKNFSENMSLEAGLSVNKYGRFLNVKYRTFDHNIGSWVYNSTFTGKYDFNEDVYAAYANFKTKIWGANTSIGLRVENTDRLLVNQVLQDAYKFNRFNYFPGLSINYPISEKQNMQFSISNRIDRPDEYMMNPFPEFEDQFFYSEGNPHLRPEIIRSYELSYNLRLEKSMFAANIFVKTTSDKIEQLQKTRSDNKLFLSFHNNANDRSIGLETMANLNPSSWWNMNLTASVTDYRIEAQIENNHYSQKRIQWNTQMVNSFNLSPTSSIELISFYNSKQVFSQSRLSSFYFVDVAFKKSFLSDRLTLSLQAKDIFRTKNFILYTDIEKISLRGYFNNESPIFMFTLRYTFSKYQKKTKDVHTEFDM